MADTLVIIPTYNEKENIANIIRAVLALDVPAHLSFHVLVVDDGSPDATAAIVKKIMGKHPHTVHLIERESKAGLGTAYIRGFKWALERGYNYICEMDADFSHSPLDLIRLRNKCIKGDIGVAVGSRYVKGGTLSDWPFSRLALSYGASLYVRLITGMPVKDPTAGFVCYERRVLESIDLDRVQFVGYAFQIEMKLAASQLGFRIGEVPICFADRTEGVSKMSGGIVKEAVFGVLGYWTIDLGLCGFV